MAKCELNLKLDEQKEIYSPGEKVAGTLEVRVDKDVTCNGLQVGLRWKTHGKGNTDSEEAVSQVLFEGDWRAGTVWQGPFELELPAGPYTYHGHYLNVVWEVFARADIPWAIDPKTDVEIALQPDPDAEPDWLTAAGSNFHVPSSLKEKLNTDQPVGPPKVGGCAGNALGIGCLLLIFLPFLGIFGVGVWQSLSFVRGDASIGETLPWMIATAVMFVLLLVGAFFGLRNYVARKKLGSVTLDLEPQLVRAGGTVDVRVGCKPEKATDLLSATARVEATEVVVRGSGTNKTTYRQTIFENDIEIVKARTLSPGLPFNEGTSIAIPEDAPPSFFASDNKLVWKVTVRLDIARWPDWVESRELLVHR